MVRQITTYGTTECPPSSNIIILGSDTDIWVYGMAYMGCGWLGNETVYVERAIGSEYVCLNAISEAVMNHPKLKNNSISLVNFSCSVHVDGWGLHK